MKKGISLIALIITIIVIIILAAITINGVSGILERSRYAKFCADLDAVQEAVSQAYGTAILEEAKKTGEKRNSEQIYKDIAGGSERSYKDKTLYQLTDEQVLGLKLPTYGMSNWYVDAKTGEVYLLSGFEYNGKLYTGKSDVDNGGQEIDYAKFHQCITVDIPAGSIPVVHNGTNWVIADKSSNWYDYREDKKQWANVFTFDADVRDEYLSKPAGTVITDEQVEKDVIGMFVYIPRYAYQITSYLHAGGNVAGNIEIVFINKQNQDCYGKVYSEEYPTTTLDGKDPSVAGTKEDKMNDFVVHPAFTDNAENGGWEHDLDGIWVAKFESSSSTTELVEDKSTDTVTVEGNGKISTNIGNNYGWSKNTSDISEYVTVRPNVTSWRNIDIINIVDKSKAMANKHGLTNTTSHQMKNSEWGAVAYLTQSKYGNATLYNNSYVEGDGYKTPITGMSGEIKEDYTSAGYKKTKKIYNDDGSIEVTFKDNNDKEYIKKYYSYDSTNGYRASCTGNIYGIYDLSAGSWEYMAAYVNNTFSPNLREAYGFDYEKNEYMPASEDISERNYVENAKKFGDAVYETSMLGWSWNQDFCGFPRSSILFFVRGSYFENSSAAGVFNFDDDTGTPHDYETFRIVVVK